MPEAYGAPEAHGAPVPPGGRRRGVGSLAALGGIVGYLVCVELTSGIVQGYYEPLLSDIARHLGIHDADVNWFEASQLLLSAIAVPVLAKLGDVVGYRRVLLWTTAVTALGAWGVALAPSFWTYLVAWTLMGTYTVWLPLEIALIHHRARRRPDARGLTRKASGVIVAALQAGVIFGALVAGQLGDGLGGDRIWMTLSVPALAVTAVFFVVLRKVPESPDVAGGRVDAGGAVLLSAALLAVGVGLLGLRLDGPDAWWVWLLVAVGLALLWPFARYELRQDDPLVDLRVVARPSLWPVLVTSGLFGVSVLGAQGPLSTFARTDPDAYGYGLGASAFTVSLLIGGYVVASLAGALTFARVSERTTPRLALVGATVLVALGYLLFLPFHDATGQVLANMVVAGLGSGALVAALPAAAAAAAPRERTAVATGLTNTTRTLGGSFASAVFALALASGATTTLDGDVGTAGSLRGYMVVWAVCGVTGLVAAALLLVVPRLAFADTAATAAAAGTTDRRTDRPEDHA
ncbi:MFS transporter [Luteimicrobium subarcticum]|uniref:MFS transporter n=1 Tax=Luteimicrobium subarcticum TaxID=620910 RepID=A0A2M8WSH5_9MICO|nr:MFS transporter [Luteimicrobium subarcticum]